MSDDISIPRAVGGPGPVSRSVSNSVSGSSSVPGSFTHHSYRARRTGMDAGTRRLVMAASALGLVLLAGMGVWTFGGHRAAGVPVIEADTRPLRVKPDNPGGMTVVGANEQVMGGHGDGAGDAGDLAPEAERPDPQALRAQRQVASAPNTVTPPAAAPPATPVGPATATITPATAPGAPATAPSAPAAAPVAQSPAAKPAPASTGGMMVQVAAVDSEALAMTEWQRLAHKAPELLGDHKPVIMKAERDGKTFWRVRTGGFADTAAAAEFCRKVRAKGLGCTIGA